MEDQILGVADAYYLNRNNVSNSLHSINVTIKVSSELIRTKQLVSTRSVKDFLKKTS